MSGEVIVGGEKIKEDEEEDEDESRFKREDLACRWDSVISLKAAFAYIYILALSFSPPKNSQQKKQNAVHWSGK